MPAVDQRLGSVMLAEGVRELAAQDSDLAAVVARFGPPPLWLRQPGFASLVKMILEQQVSLASACAAYARLQGCVGRVTPHTVLGVEPTRLHQAGITRQKTRYCQELAQRVVSGSLNLGDLAERSNREVVAALIEVPGIGRWTAEVYLLMALGRVDVWPWGDVALATAVWRLKELEQRPEHDQLVDMSAVWAPWRAVAARIFWHYYLKTPRHLTGKPV
jgi:DNA-3-methyladenine glycosylase II